MNDGYGRHYFNLERGARQEDPLSTYFFILILDILFILTKYNKKIRCIKIFKHKQLSTAYADHTTSLKKM